MNEIEKQAWLKDDNCWLEEKEIRKFSVRSDFDLFVIPFLFCNPT